MSQFPPPPKSNRLSPPPPEPVTTPTPPLDKKDTLLSDEEVQHILKTTLRQEQFEDMPTLQFIMCYLQCRNTAQAAREVGWTSAKGSYARNRPEIHLAIERLTSKAVMKYGYDAYEVIERVKEISSLDPIEFENPDGSFKTHLSQIPPEARRAIKKFKCKNIFGVDPNGMKIVIGQLIEVELWDKLKASELLGREKNIMKETKKVEHDVTSNMANLLLESKRRAEQRTLSPPPDEPLMIDVTPKVANENKD